MIALKHINSSLRGWEEFRGLAVETCKDVKLSLIKEIGIDPRRNGVITTTLLMKNGSLYPLSVENPVDSVVKCSEADLPKTTSNVRRSEVAKISFLCS